MTLYCLYHNDLQNMRQQVVTNHLNTSDLFYHLKTRRDVYRYLDIKLAIRIKHFVHITQHQDQQTFSLCPSGLP